MDGIEPANPPELQAVQLPRWVLLLPGAFRRIKGYASEIDLSTRLLLFSVVLVNFVARFSRDQKAYTLTEMKIMLCSAAALLTGFHHCSLLFYPFLRRLTIQVYITLLFVYVSMTFDRFEGYLLIKPPNKDAIFLVSYYIYMSILLPNVAGIVFIFLLITIALIGAMLLQMLASFGYDYRPWRDPRLTRMESKAEKFRRQYKQLLNGYFYKHVREVDREFISMDEDPRLEELSVITMHQPFSCADFKTNMERQVERRIGSRQPDLPGDGDESVDSVCSICYVPFKNGAYLIELPVCHHTFHYGCLGSWLDKNPNCPICRFDLYQHFATQNTRAIMRQERAGG